VSASTAGMSLPRVTPAQARTYKCFSDRFKVHRALVHLVDQGARHRPSGGPDSSRTHLSTRNETVAPRAAARLARPPPVYLKTPVFTHSFLRSAHQSTANPLRT
jgi:hypothetical protein